MTELSVETPELRAVQRTIAFTDLVGSTTLADEQGDLAFVQMLGMHESMVREVTAKWRGEFVKNVGDGAMVAFCDASNAVACAIELQRRARAVGLQLRVGADAGTVQLRVDGDYFGLVANLAARLTTMARSGEILLSERVLGAAHLAGRVRPSAVRGLRSRLGVRSLMITKAAV